MTRLEEYTEECRAGKMTDTEKEVRERGTLLVKIVAGSQSFGLEGPDSDIDIHGVFTWNPEERIKSGCPDQIADEANNEVYWDIAKFLKELNSANPQALEMLYAPDDCIIVGKRLLNTIQESMDFLTMRCNKSFCEYARGQVNRATGLNKKVFKPKPAGNPFVLDYCFVPCMENGQALPFKEWLQKYHSSDEYGSDQKWYALAAIDHIDMGYAIYGQPVFERFNDQERPEHEWRWAYGVVRDEVNSGDIQLNSIPKNRPVLGFMWFNRNAYSKECKERAQYRDWVKKRNPARYNQTLQHGQGYDAKNIMHCVRLLLTAYGIARDHTVPVNRKFTTTSSEIGMEANIHPYDTDRDFLLAIKRGEWKFDDIIHYIDVIGKVVDETFKASGIKEDSYPQNAIDDLAIYLDAHKDDFYD